MNRVRNEEASRVCVPCIGVAPFVLSIRTFQGIQTLVRLCDSQLCRWRILVFPSRQQRLWKVGRLPYCMYHTPDLPHGLSSTIPGVFMKPEQTLSTTGKNLHGDQVLAGRAQSHSATSPYHAHPFLSCATT